MRSLADSHPSSNGEDGFKGNLKAMRQSPILTPVQGPVREGLTQGVKMEAERAGFEPAIQFDPYAALAKRCLRPLGHLSRCGRGLYPLTRRGQGGVTGRPHIEDPLAVRDPYDNAAGGHAPRGLAG